ncbi:MAG: thioredoxin [Clostridia bacterium]
MSVLTITTENFEQEVLKSEVPVLIDFWATWCGPCKMMGPVVEEIAQELGETVKVGKINIDEQTDLATRFGVMSIPTFLVFKQGKTAGMTVGVQPKENITKLLK